jgi:hypothetical protein
MLMGGLFRERARNARRERLMRKAPPGMANLKRYSIVISTLYNIGPLG